VEGVVVVVGAVAGVDAGPPQADPTISNSTMQPRGIIEIRAAEWME
jgi:hypothetical protein